MPGINDMLAAGRERKRRRVAEMEAYGSEIYPWTPAVIVAGATSLCIVATQFPDARRYQPLDWARVVNKDAVDLKAYVNQVSAIEIPKGSIIEIDDFPAIWSILLENLDGATDTTAGKVVVEFRKQPMTADKLSRLQVAPS
jgi:hypothetical protein